MVTIANYFKEIEKVGVNNLPETLHKSHDFLLKTTSNGSSLDLYDKNETIRKTINIYLTKLNEFIGSKGQESITKQKLPQSHSEQKPVSKKQDKSRAVSIKQKDTVTKVEHIREEIKYIKRFIGLHNKVKSMNAILSFIKALQRSIVQKLIRKTSPLASEIEMIQDKLVNAFNKMKGEEKFEINDKDLPKLIAIAGGEEVYPSINLIKRFIGLQGKVLEENKIESFVLQLENALKNKKIASDDPYADKVKAILKRLKNRPSAKISISKSELSGLEGIVKSCTCKKGIGKNHHADHKQLKNSHAKKGTYYTRGLNGLSNGVLTAEQMANRQFERLHFSKPWDTLMGNPARNFNIMFHGDPGAGKTTLLLKFAEYLALNFGRVIYISSEEHDASTLTDKINELLNPKPENLDFAPDLRTPDLSNYNFVFLDSVNDLGLKLEDFKNMKKKYPNTSFILILQHTKDGDYRGGKDWEHDIQIAAKVESGVVSIYRNRYGVKGSLDFFNYFNTKSTQSLPNISPNNSDDNLI